MVNEVIDDREGKVPTEPKKGFPLKLIIIILSVLVVGVLLAVGGYFIYTKVMSDDISKADNLPPGISKEEKANSEVKKESIIFPLDTFYANLADSDEIRYLTLIVIVIYNHFCDWSIDVLPSQFADVSLFVIFKLPFLFK